MKNLTIVLLMTICTTVYSQDMTKEELLASIIAAECNICDLQEKYYVGSVVLNRIDHYYFPDNIYDVITQPSQFQAYGSRWFEPNSECLEVARDLLNDIGRDYDILYFYCPYTSYWKFVRDMEQCTSHKMEYHFYAEFCD